MSDHWNLLIFQGYNGSVQIHGLRIIGPITWSYVIGWKMVGMMIQSDLGIGIIESKIWNSDHNWYALQLMSVEIKYIF